MKVFYDKDCDLSLIKGKTVAIIGYGSQGHAHAQNLNDSGVKVVVGLRKGGASWDKVGKAGLNVLEVNDAVKSADVVMILLPDEQIAEVYKNNVEPNIKQGASLAFAHGFNVHYNQVVPRADLDVWMVAPKAPGHTVRNTYTIELTGDLGKNDAFLQAIERSAILETVRTGPSGIGRGERILRV